jgi:membrane associated rhomboid family serine protease
MLYDRTYMRKPLFQDGFSLVDKLIILLLASFVFQSLMALAGFDSSFSNKVSLSRDGLGSGFLWTLISYSLLHEGPLHLVFNLLGIYFIGRSVNRDVKPSDFIWLSLLSVMLGGIFWLCVNSGSLRLIGASAIVSGYLSYFCLQRPNAPISFLLFFVLPLKLKPKVILYGVIGLEIYGLIFSELSRTGGIAHSAHLGGVTAGFLFYILQKNNFSLPVFKFSTGSKFNVKKSSPFAPDFQVNMSTDEHIYEEVNRILDKINAKGFGSLTNTEKQLLDKAKSFLQKD